METLVPAKLVIENGVVHSHDYQDIYFSADDGLAETRHVFHEGNDLENVWANKNHYTIAETGFGTGLNFLATWRLYKQSPERPARLHYISIEKHPLSLEDLKRCYLLFDGLEPLCNELIANYPPLVSGFHRVWLDQNRVCLTLCLLDIAPAIDQLAGTVDCWFLDGFAPARNPLMWGENVFRGIARLSKPGTRFSTFTAAGDVRRGLAGQGFRVEKKPGFGRKRDMLAGELQQPAIYRDLTLWYRRPPATAHASKSQPKKAIIVGAGIAGAQAAWHLAIRGWQVEVIERNAGVAMEASGNPAAVICPRISAKPSIAEQFSVQAFLYQLQQFYHLGFDHCGWHPCGVLQLAYSGEKLKKWHGLRQRQLPRSILTCIGREEAAQVAGIDITHAALLFEHAGWVQPVTLVEKLLDHEAISVTRSRPIVSLQDKDNLWQAIDDQGDCVASGGVVIIASGSNLDFPQTSRLPHTPVKGQTSFAEATEHSSKLRTVVQHDGYITPLINGRHLLGATYIRNATGGCTDLESDNQNLQKLALHASVITNNLGTLSSAHAATRMTSSNRLPYIGPVPDEDTLTSQFPAMHRKGFAHSPATSGYYKNLYISGAYGSRGFTNAALGGELIASLICGEPLPVQTRLFHALHPARSIVKKLQRT